MRPLVSSAPWLALALGLCLPLGLGAGLGVASCELDPLTPPADAAVDADGPPGDAWVDSGDATDAALGDAALDASVIGDGGLDASVLADGGAPDGGDGGILSCPSDMALINGNYCIDLWEASRPDATATSGGVDNSYAQSVPGVIPWFSFTLTKAEAAAACAAAGKRLCAPAEWQTACQGPAQTVYSYGDPYDPVACNGIDTFCLCGSGQACDGVSPCPYPHCWNQPPPTGPPPTACGAAFHVVPTGSFPSCTNGFGLYDLNGNVWEVVEAGDALQHFRGGAYNCSDSELLHRCDYDATWGPSAKGFRCCKDP